MSESFTPEDLLRYELVRDVQLRPDGQELAAEIKRIDEEADTYRTEIRLFPCEGGEPVTLTHDDWSAMPRWSPDGGRLAFVSDREGQGLQAHLIRRDGGEATMLAKLPHGALSLSWSPDGTHLLASSSVDNEEPPKSKAERTRWSQRPRVVDRQRYKSDGAGFLLHKTSQLFVLEARPGGKARQLTHGAADATSATWDPSGRRIAYCQAREDIRQSHITDLAVLDLDGGKPRIVCTEVPSAAKAAWSPDGRWIAFTGAPAPGDSRTRLWLYDVEQERLLRPGEGDGYETGSYPLTRSSPPRWSADSRRLAFLHARDGFTQVAVISVPDGKLLSLLGGERQATCLHACESRLAYATSELREPVAIRVNDWSGERERVVSVPNGHWWSQRRLPRVERRQFSMDDGRRISGWLLRPEDAAGPAPLLVDVHGGPASYVEFEFPYHVNWYALLSRGWSVLALDPTGSGSYGPQSAEALRGRWGELDLKQHLAAWDQLRSDGVASDQAVIAGKSYGGYMAAWAIGHTDRFAAAIVSAPVANLESHAGTSDSGYYVMPYDMGGELAERRETFRALSPVQHAHKAVTPTLILQGEKDQRCPIGQAEELFSILMRNGKAPVQMVVYPGGHHDLAEDGRPSHRVDYHRRVVDWAERWTGRQPQRRRKRSSTKARPAAASPPRSSQDPATATLHRR